MALGKIKIIATPPPTLTFNVDGTNIIPVASIVSSPYTVMEYELQDRAGFRKLTWRDFTIDMSPFDFNYEKITHVKIEEMGTYNINDLQDFTPYPPGFTKGCLKPELNIATSPSYMVGDVIPVTFNNTTNATNKSMVRMDSFPPPIYISLNTPNTNTPDYAKVRLYYNGVPSTKIKVIYTYNSFGTSPMIGSFLENAIIEIKSDAIYPIYGNNLLKGLDYHVSPWNNFNAVLNFETQVVGVSPVKTTLEALFPAIYQYSPKGNPVKITIWDDNQSPSRILVNGESLVNGMSIPFETFNQGFVLFNAMGLNPNTTYQVSFSVMDLATGLLVFKTR